MRNSPYRLLSDLDAPPRPLWDHDAEVRLLGKLIAADDRDTVAKCIRILPTSDAFCGHAHIREFYSAIVRLHHEGETVNEETLALALHRWRKLSEDTGLTVSAINGLSASVDNISARWQSDAIRIAKLARQREAYARAQDAAKSISDPSLDESEVELRITHAAESIAGCGSMGSSPARQLECIAENLQRYAQDGDDVRTMSLAGAARALATAMREEQPLGAEAIDLAELDNFDAINDPTQLLGNRFLCERGTLCLFGESGIGKSSLAMHAGLYWAAGRDFFGIRPARPLRILLLQKENDKGDLAEAWQGVRHDSGFSAMEESAIRQNFAIRHETIRTGAAFAIWLESEIIRHRAELVIVDPLLSFAGCAVSDQKELTPFIRGLIQPVLERTRAALLLVHHSGKPPAHAVMGDRMDDNALKYFGIGSSDLTNWARAIMTLRLVQAEGGVCELAIPKRGKRAGLLDDENTPTTRVYLKHGERSIVWQYAPEYAASRRAAEAKNKAAKEVTRTRKTGPEQSFSIRDLCEFMGTQEFKPGELNKAAAAHFGVGISCIKKRRHEAEAKGVIIKATGGLLKARLSSLAPAKDNKPTPATLHAEVV